MSSCAVLTRDQLNMLAEEIVDWSVRIDLATQALFTHLRMFDEHEGWAGSGFGSTAAWLAWRVEMSPSAAREHVRVARALGKLHLIDEAFAAGKLSYSKVRAITRAATPETEQAFLDIAMHATAAQIDRLASAYRRSRIDSKQPNLDVRRFLRRGETRGGMVRIELQLPPEQANIVWEAMFAALDSGRSEAAEQDAGAPAEARAEQDAGAPAEARAELDPANMEAERADALVSVAQAYLQHDHPRTLGSGYELVMLTTPEQLEHGPGGVGGFLPDGTPVPHHIARMLACDCSRVDVTSSESGEILDVGRARRTIPSAIGRALRLRDGGCRVPGCGRRHHLHAHHIESWAEGGKTSQSNLVLLCPSHHTLVHEGQLFIHVRDGKLEFRNAYGLEICAAPRRVQDREAPDRWWRDTPKVDRFPLWDGAPMDLEYVMNSSLAGR